MANLLLIKKIQVGNQAYSVYDERVQKPVPADAKFTDTTYGAEKGISLNNGKFGHSNSIGAQGTQGLYKISWDAQGHITGVTGVQKSDITELGIPGQDTTYSAEKGISLNGGKFGHSNTAITAVTDAAVFKKIKYDTYGHITGVEAVKKGDITALGIPGQDTTYTGEGGITVDGTKIKHSNSIDAQGAQGLYKMTWDAQGHITGAFAVSKGDITALGIPGQDTKYTGSDGIKLDGTTFKHTNSITKQDTAVFKKIKYDAYGHITGTEDVKPGDITPLIEGATTQITTLQTLVDKIKAELENPSAAGGLTSVLDTMQAVLNTSAQAVTKITYTKQALSVDSNGVLSISDGAVTPTTAAFVTAKP